jgi:hypothetical protein
MHIVTKDSSRPGLESQDAASSITFITETVDPWLVFRLANLVLSLTLREELGPEVIKAINLIVYPKTSFTTTPVGGHHTPSSG